MRVHFFLLPCALASSLQSIIFETIRSQIGNVSNAITRFGLIQTGMDSPPGFEHELLSFIALYRHDMSTSDLLQTFVEENRPCFYEDVPRQLRNTYFRYLSEDLSVSVDETTSSLIFTDDKLLFPSAEIPVSSAKLLSERFAYLVIGQNRIFVDLVQKCAATLKHEHVISFMPHRRILIMRSHESSLLSLPEPPRSPYDLMMIMGERKYQRMRGLNVRLLMTNQGYIDRQVDHDVLTIYFQNKSQKIVPLMLGVANASHASIVRSSDSLWFQDVVVFESEDSTLVIKLKEGSSLDRMLTMPPRYDYFSVASSTAEEKYSQENPTELAVNEDSASMENLQLRGVFGEHRLYVHMTTADQGFRLAVFVASS